MALHTALLVALSLAVQQNTIARNTGDCDQITFRGTRTSTTLHSDSDDDSSVISFMHVSDDRCTSAAIVGKMTYTDAEDDIATMSFGSYAVFRERTPSTDRALSFTRDSDGQIVRSYQLNRQTTAYDADAQRWFASFLPHVLSEAGINVKPRVARWRAQGGVDNVLTNIAAMSSSGSKRAHYEALFDGAKLSDDELDRTIRSISETMRGSSGDLRSILLRAAPSVRLSKRSLVAFESAMLAMPSSGDKASVLMTYGQTADHDMLTTVARVAETIPSSGDKSGVLTVLAPRYLTSKDHGLEHAFFDVTKEIPSSGDLRGVLLIAVPYAISSADIAMQVIEMSRAIASSGDRSSVLISLVGSGALRTKELRDAFFVAAADIPSEGDRSRVLRAAAKS